MLSLLIGHDSQFFFFFKETLVIKVTLGEEVEWDLIKKARFLL